MTKPRARSAPSTRTRWHEKILLASAAIIALAIWLPLPGDDASLTQRREAKFIAKDDPPANTAHLSARPLLDPARSAASSTTAAKPKASASSNEDIGERYTLRGLARVDNTDVAIFDDKTTRRSLRLQRGQAIGDWYLAEVQGDQAILKNAAGTARPMPLSTKPK